MTSACSPWLPHGYLDDKLSQLLQSDLDAWAADWLAPSISAPEVKTAAYPAVKAGRLGEVMEAKSFCLSWDDQGRAALLGALLGRKVEKSSVSEQDRKITDPLISDVVRDLSERLERKLPKEVHAGPRPATLSSTKAMVLAVMINDQCICRVSADVSVWTALFKLQASVSIGSKGDTVVNRREAIKESKVRIRALIGKAHISFHELEGLSVGDVIIIDSYRDGFADVALEDSESRIGSGEINHDDGVVKILLS